MGLVNQIESYGLLCTKLIETLSGVHNYYNDLVSYEYDLVRVYINSPQKCLPGGTLRDEMSMTGVLKEERVVIVA